MERSKLDFFGSSNVHEMKDKSTVGGNGIVSTLVQIQRSHQPLPERLGLVPW